MLTLIAAWNKFLASLAKVVVKDIGVLIALASSIVEVLEPSVVLSANITFSSYFIQVGNYIVTRIALVAG